MKQKSDAQLVMEAKKGSEDAFTEIYRRYEKSLFYTAYKLTNNKDDAGDALQDTFLQVSRSIHHLQRPEYLKLWLNRIITGKCRDIFRRNKTLSIDMDDPQFCNHYAEERREFVPEQQLHFKNDQEVLEYYIAQLPYVQREALVLTYFEHMSMQQIADLFDEPVGTIKSRIHLAKKTLQQRLSSYESREQVKLDFHSIGFDVWMSTMMVTGSNTLAQSLFPAGGAVAAKSSGFSISSILGGVGGKAAIVGTLSITMGTGVMAYQEIQKQKVEQEVRNNTHQTMGVSFEEQEIRSGHEAYFLLMNWAMNEEQMKMKSQEEIAQYRPIYLYLKESNSAYYQTLKKSGMVEILEQYF